MNCIGIAAVGNVNDINCWSNIPYFFLQEGKKQGVFHDGWNLDLRAFKSHRIYWNIKQLVKGGKTGGFQYSREFLTKAENQIPDSLKRNKVITFNQHFPRAKTIVKMGGELYHFIDTTFYDLITAESYGVKLSKAKIREAIALEKENFQLSTAIVTMASWVTNSLIDYYKIPEEKIFTILPGANLDLPSDFKIKDKSGGAGRDRDLNLGFIGKDWERKGLTLLNDIKENLNKKGYKVKLHIIGQAPERIAMASNVVYHGFVDKHKEKGRFVDIVNQCDLGCLLSTHEALGISTLEFIRLGIPVMGFYHMGLKDTLLKDASIRVEPGTTCESITEVLERFINDFSYQDALVENAKARTDFVSWGRCVGEWKEKVLQV